MFESTYVYYWLVRYLSVCIEVSILATAQILMT